MNARADRATAWRRLARALHRATLLAYPRAFRAEFADDLEHVFDARLTAARATRSRLGALPVAAFHLADAIASGLVARLNPPILQSPHPPIHTMSLLDSVRSDVRFAMRQFRHAPMFSLLTVATLALGIGATSAIFAVVNAVLLRPLPYVDPGRLVMVWSHNTRQHEPNNPVSPANFAAFRDGHVFADTQAMYSFLTSLQVRLDADPEFVQVATVTPGMFAMLGRQAEYGRPFREGDPDFVVVLSHQYWWRRFGGDPTVVGRAITIVGASAPVTVLGVMPDDFVFPYRSMLGPSGFSRATQPDIWLPLSPRVDTRLVDATGQPTRTIHYLAVVARLKPGATIETARADLETIATTRARDFPDTNSGWGITARPLHEQAVGAMKPALVTLLIGVGVVLLITCINVANVLLARATSRHRDLAIRSALGASGRRLIQQALVESTTLALAGGLAGLGLMWLGTRALIAVAPTNLPRLSEARPDLAVALFAIAVSVVTGLAVGVLPAAGAARSRAENALQESQRTTASPSRRRLRSGLIVTEVAMAMVLTIGAGLLLRSFIAVLDTDPGFVPDHLLTFQMSLPAGIPAPLPARVAFYDDLEARLRAIPGVTNVGGTTRLPLGSTNVTSQMDIDGRGLAPADMPEVEFRRASFDFFGTMGIPVVRGRGFTREDDLTAPPVAIVNTVLAARVFPNEDPLGQRVHLGPNPGARWITIVGVVGSIKHASLEEAPRPELYMPARQNPPNGPFVVLRTAVDPTTIAAAVRAVLKEAHVDPPASIRSMDEIRGDSVAERRFVLLLVALFGVLALTLASIGVYGVITLVAAERTTEVGIRLALGASPSDMLTLVLGQALGLAVTGVLVGGVAGLLLTRAMASQLFGVGSADPITYVTVAAVLLTTSLVAAFSPARRAMRTDPATTLRREGRT
jgi:predicted permease